MWWFLAIAYAVANIFLHEQVNHLVERLIELMGLWPFMWTARLSALFGTILFLVLGRHNFLRNPDRIKKLLIFIPVGVALDLSLVIYASERIHYPQYAILTLIAYKAIGKSLPAALFSYVVGYVDEAHQHWVLYANDPIAYFDWNDIVLNLLGAIAPLLLLPEGPLHKIQKRNIFAAIVFWIIGMRLLVFLLNPDAMLMRSHQDTSFWLTSNIRTHYHVLNALEGSILLGIMWILVFGYYWPSRQKLRPSPYPLPEREDEVVKVM